MANCPNCNNKIANGSKFCNACGAAISEATISEAAIADVQEPKEKRSTITEWLKQLPLKWCAIGVGALAVLVGIILLLCLLLGAMSEQDHILLVKDDEIFFYDMSDDKPWQITRQLYDNADTPENREVAEWLASAYAQFCTLSQDGKLLFFLDRLDDSSDGISLYYRHVNKPEEDPIKISSEVRTYAVNEKATIVTYEKGEDRVLYQYYLKEDRIEKIGSDVAHWSVSEDGTKICYLNTEGGLYVQYKGESKEKIDSDVTELSYITEDFETVYYVKDDSLYKKTQDAEKDKLVSGITSVIRVYENGSIYYLKEESSQDAYEDYLLDDLAESDALMTMPEEPSEPSVYDYESAWQYEVAYQQYEEAYAAYVSEYEAYQRKLLRDQLREALQGQTLDLELGQLYYYDGEDTHVVTDSYIESDDMVAEDTPVMITYLYNQAAFEKVKLSEVADSDDIESEEDLENVLQEALLAALSAAVEQHVVVGSDMTLIELNNPVSFDEPTRFYLNEDGTNIYYIDDIPEDKEHGELYRIQITEGEVQAPELYDSDVYVDYLYYASENQFVYFKDVDSEDAKGDLYINKNRIDYDVRLYSESYVEEDKKIVYITDWNSEKEYGTLKVYQDEKATKISDDVYDYGLSLHGEVFYLYDYSTTYYKGDLYIYSDGDNEKIDMDVVALMPVFQNE